MLRSLKGCAGGGARCRDSCVRVWGSCFAQDAQRLGDGSAAGDAAGVTAGDGPGGARKRLRSALGGGAAAAAGASPAGSPPGTSPPTGLRGKTVSGKGVRGASPGSTPPDGAPRARLGPGKRAGDGSAGGAAAPASPSRAAGKEGGAPAPGGVGKDGGARPGNKIKIVRFPSATMPSGAGGDKDKGEKAERAARVSSGGGGAAAASAGGGGGAGGSVNPAPTYETTYDAYFDMRYPDWLPHPALRSGKRGIQLCAVQLSQGSKKGGTDFASAV